jgi:universal stress protein A
MKVAIQKILFPTDFSECSEFALKYAQTLAVAFEAEIHALHIVHDPYPMPSATGLSAAPPPELLAVLTRQAERRIADQVDEAMKTYSKIRCFVRSGDPVREIKQYADLHDIDLIVMGTHGVRGMAHLLIGSVAEKLVRIATCPVLSVHSDGRHFVA